MRQKAIIEAYALINKSKHTKMNKRYISTCSVASGTTPDVV